MTWAATFGRHICLLSSALSVIITGSGGRADWRFKDECSASVLFRRGATTVVIRRMGVVIAALIVALAAVGAVQAADTFGFVNVQDVFQGYEKTAKSNAELDALSKQLVAKLQVMDENLLLSDSELQELMTLRIKGQLTDPENARMKALQDREIVLDKELADLSSKKEPTAQEQARLKELQDRQVKSRESSDKLKDESEKTFGDRSKALSQEIRDDIVKAIEAVAKDKKLSMVVDKEAVLYGGTDVTKDVLDKLGKK